MRWIILCPQLRRILNYFTINSYRETARITPYRCFFTWRHDPSSNYRIFFHWLPSLHLLSQVCFKNFFFPIHSRQLLFHKTEHRSQQTWYRKETNQMSTQWTHISLCLISFKVLNLLSLAHSTLPSTLDNLTLYFQPVVLLVLPTNHISSIIIVLLYYYIFTICSFTAMQQQSI